MAYTRSLDAVEQRIVGALMEKESTTPDLYPLTVKSLTAACNQKSNRDPVVELDEHTLRDGLERLRRDVLVWRTTGARVERWEHRITSRWHLDTPAKAVIALLLLRGPQTPGELRSRSERHHAFESRDEVEAVLRRLSEGQDALVEELPRRPGQRETRWRHLMDADGPEPGAWVDSDDVAMPGGVRSRAAATAVALLEARLKALEARMARLEEQLGISDDEGADDEGSGDEGHGGDG